MKRTINYSLLFIIMLLCIEVAGQQKQLGGVKLTKEQQKAIQLALENQMISEEDFQNSNEKETPSPVKITPQQNRIATIPNIPLQQDRMMQYVRNLSQVLDNVMDPELKQAVNKFIAEKSTTTVAQTSVLIWYQGAEESALKLALKALENEPDSTMHWNNLGALLNLMNMQELAIPVLKYGLYKENQNPSVLNNLGQAYLGLGETKKAEEYLKSCLQRSPKHPEATRSMGVIAQSNGDTELAAEYFQEDLKMNLRESTFDWLKKIKKRQDINLNAIRKEFLNRKGAGEKDFYGMIALNQLSMPMLPLSCEDSERWLEELDPYVQAINEEYLYWQNKTNEYSQNEISWNTHKTDPYYSWIVNEVVYELTNTWQDDLLPSNPIFIEEMALRTIDYHEKLSQLKCPDPPDFTDIKLLKLYDQKCCEMKKGIINPFMATYNEKVRHNYEIRNGNWKQFLNELINTVEICPTPSNKHLVYQYLTNYTMFLTGTVQMVVAEPEPSGCDELTPEEIEEILRQSKRTLDIQCPSWLKYELPFPGVGSVKMNCSEFQIEGTPASIVKAGYKKNFKDQTSTLYVGVGPSIKAGPVSVGATVQGYLVFDNQNQLVNTGISAEGKVSLPKGIAELSATAKLEMNSGYSHEVKTDSRWINQLKRTLTKY